MALIQVVLNKMMQNKWLVVFLITGLTVCIAMLSSIPFYTEGLLNNALIKNMENFQLDTDEYPGTFVVSAVLYKDAGTGTRNSLFLELQDYFLNRIPGRYGVSSIAKVENPMVEFVRLTYADRDRAEENRPKDMKLEAFSGIENHITIVEGRLPSDVMVNGAYEVMLTEEALYDMKTVLGNEFILTNYYEKSMEPVRVKLVGVFEPKNESGTYWFKKIKRLNNSIVMNYDLMQSVFNRKERCYLTGVNWSIPFDYRQMRIGNVNKLMDTADDLQRYIQDNPMGSSIKVEIPIVKNLADYAEKEKQLKLLLWSLNVPIIFVICFYLVMVSSLIVEKEGNEIAILKSRGAGPLQIVAVYLFESLFMGFMAVCLGLPLGFIICKVMGISNGFLEFVKRKPLNFSFSLTVVIYSLIAVGICIVMMLVPAYLASRKSIVKYKQEISRSDKKPLWQKLFMDFILMGLSVYGIQTFRRMKLIFDANGGKIEESYVDQLIFLSGTFFIIGSILIFLRLFPLLLKLVYNMGEKVWPVPVYLALTQVGRNTSRYQYLMIYLALMLAAGLFSANSARTVNQNHIEKILYKYGADIVIKPEWKTEPEGTGRAGDLPAFGLQGDAAGFTGAISEETRRGIRYIEPDFEDFATLPGVDTATKVYISENAQPYFRNTALMPARLMGIESNKFGRVAWLRNDLLKTHWYHYLNLLAYEPSAVLISRSLSEKYKIEKGDRINVQWGNNGMAEFIVFGIIDYWPSWNPGEKTEKGQAALIVGNFSYIEFNMQKEPYEIWIKRDMSVSNSEMSGAISERKLSVEKLVDRSDAIVKAKNDIHQMGINGALSMGFCIIVLIGLEGFLIYWVLSMRSRTLQFGILRAMGMAMKKLIWMMVCEQALTSLASMVAGMVVGMAASRLFVPFFQLSYCTVEQVPPFKVISSAGDHIKLYTIIGLVLVLGLSTIGVMLKKINVNQALKLGED